MYAYFVTAVVIASCLSTIEGQMTCYTCYAGPLPMNPYTTDNCLGPNISNIYLQPCLVATDVCVTISVYERKHNSTVIMRGCGHPHKSECENVKQKLFDNKYCIEKCTTDGCNGKPYTGGSKAPETAAVKSLALFLTVLHIST